MNLKNQKSLQRRRARVNIRMLWHQKMLVENVGAEAVVSGSKTAKTIVNLYNALSDAIAILNHFYISQGLIDPDKKGVNSMTFNDILAKIKEIECQPGFEAITPDDMARIESGIDRRLDDLGFIPKAEMDKEFVDDDEDDDLSVEGDDE